MSQSGDRDQTQFILGIGAKEVIPVEKAGSTAQQARNLFTGEATELMKKPDAQLLIGAGQAAKNRRGNAQQK
ncbi:hypothetical protein ASPCAL01849 [Aspergillus calidoustus]|jgi:hypothetical protein|uniref:Uncharacterized protein n=1 Tax=Aspergillus calidoustus TaxID=454130 RepID=A0A0U5GNP0_ASPCI|nr:hypothetical protein ASPCAL01849 [Aspergillus calidoustus]